MSNYLKDMFIEVRDNAPEVVPQIDTLISEVYSLLEQSLTINERDANQGSMFPQKKTYPYKAIPAPSVSELGWASLNSNDDGAAAKREELEQYIGRIPGSDLRVKLKNVSRLLNDPNYAKSLAGFGDSQGERIASTLSYLVFLKTLTTVITNFNASSAGFNFEAFLAVLLGGSQIPASGATTIADLTTSDGTPISLKLYNEKTVKAGGSYNDLISDLTRSPYMMRYVVATKTLSGKDLQRKGKIEVYQYDLNSDNLPEILYSSASGENSELIRLPRSVVARERKLNFKVPKMGTLDDIETKFYEILNSEIGSEPWFEDLRTAMDYQNNRNLFVKKKPGYQPFTAGTWYGRKGIPSAKAPLFLLLNNFIQERELDIEPVKLFNLLYVAQERAKESYYKAVKKLDAIGSGLGAYASARDSIDFFNDLSRAEKRKALMLTLGAIRYGNQYELRRNDIYGIARLAKPYNVYAPGQKDVKIGEIEIGRESVQEVFNSLVDDVNRTVFEIFEELSVLSENLQGFFAPGLQDTGKADAAIGSAKNIGTKTKQTKDIK